MFSQKNLIGTKPKSNGNNSQKLISKKLIGVGYIYPTISPIQYVKNENITDYNSSYSPSETYKTGLKYIISSKEQINNPLYPTFDSTNVTFDSEIITFDNTY